MNQCDQSGEREREEGERVRVRDVKRTPSQNAVAVLIKSLCLEASQPGHTQIYEKYYPYTYMLYAGH
jgi:NADPH-dependent 7-cyano-7-deazaguanine reductase QueF